MQTLKRIEHNNKFRYTIWFTCRNTIRGVDTQALDVTMCFIAMTPFLSQNDLYQAGGRVGRGRSNVNALRFFWAVTLQDVQFSHELEAMLEESIAEMLHEWGKEVMETLVCGTQRLHHEIDGDFAPKLLKKEKDEGKSLRGGKSEGNPSATSSKSTNSRKRHNLGINPLNTIDLSNLSEPVKQVVLPVAQPIAQAH
jgi:hypothetical protein